jgi:predicted SAM-dependent methyltransferase
MVKVDLACGDNKKEGFIGLDISDCEGVDKVHDLNIYPWPFEDNSVDEVHCSHYIEHIPHLNIQAVLKQSNSFDEFKEKLSNDKDGFIKFFNELYRIMKPGATATIIAPYYMSVRAFGDPTHQRYIGDFSFYYVNKEWRDNNKLSHYGITCNFDAEMSYYVSNNMMLKSAEVRDKAFKEDWNAIDDIIVKLTKI